MSPIARLVPLLLAALVPGAARAELAAGFWSFPDRPGLPVADLAALCETGFSLVHADGVHQSYLRVETPQGGALMLDSQMTCTSGAEAVSCEGWVDNGAGPVANAFASRPSRDGSGALRYETLNTNADSGAAPVITFPQPCPAEGIRAALALGVIPAP